MRMTTASRLSALTAVLTAALTACGSDGKKPTDTSDASAGAGGMGTGGADQDAGTGGTVVSTGGQGGADSGSGGAGTGGATGGAAGSSFQGLPGYPIVPYTPQNPDDAQKAMLGKVLFWEEQLGENDTMACGTCHRAEAGGSDPRSATVAAMSNGFNGTADTNPGFVTGSTGITATSDDLRVSLGVHQCGTDGGVIDPAIQKTGRKAPTYLDAMFALEIFWDGRAGFCKNGEAAGGCFYDPDLPNGSPPLITLAFDTTANRNAGGALEAQAAGPPVSSVEMACQGQTWASIAAKLSTGGPSGTGVIPLALAQAVPPDMEAFITGKTYPQLFQQVYGSTNKVNPTTDADDVINTRRIVFAIATHERRLKSDQTPWDRWNAGDSAAMTPAQVAGFEAFMTRGACNTPCHAPPLFTDGALHNIGFHKPDWDKGRGDTATFPAATAAEAGKFKTPSLRNVGLREAGGLLHSGDGPGHDLTAIMQLYRQGGIRSDPAIAPLIDLQLLVLSTLTDTDMTNIIDFMRNALTDPRVAAVPPLAPFDRPKLSTE